MKNEENQDLPFRLVVAVPTMGAVHPNLVARLLKWSKDYPKGAVNFYFTYKVTPVERARNQCVEFFLYGKRMGNEEAKPSSFTHLLFIDHDTIPPVEGLSKLLSHDKDICTGLTPMLQYDKQKNQWATMYNAFCRIKDAEGKTIQSKVPPVDGKLHEVDRCGSSFILIKRKVFEAMQKPYYKFTLTDDGLEHKISEDIRFCDEAKSLGFQVFADTSVICEHHKSVML